MNYKDPIYWLIILSVSFFLWGTCQKNKVLELKAESVKAQHQEQLKDLENKAAVFKASADAEKRARETARDSAKVQQRAKEVALVANLATISALKKKLAPKLAENPDIDTLVQAQERAYKKLDSLYKGAELQHAAEIVSYEKELKDRAEQLMIERTKSDVFNEVLAEREKEIRKLTRGKRFRNVVIGTLVGGIVYLSLKE